MPSERGDEVSPLYRRLAEQAIDAYNRRDPEAFASIWHPNCEWHPFFTARVEGDPGYHGYNGIRTWFEDVDEMFSETHGELDDIRNIQGHLVGLGQLRARGRGRGAEMNSEVAWVLEVEGERIRRGWAYTSHEDALRAAWGLG
jgi:ketosteroid isomerase-like protein